PARAARGRARPLRSARPPGGLRGPAPRHPRSARPSSHPRAPRSPRPAVDDDLGMTSPRPLERAEVLGLRHVRFGYFALLAFLTLGVALEALHGFKIGFYLDVASEP